jgi:cytochrome P450
VVDLLEAYDRPLPSRVICALLGIPAADRAWVAAEVAAYDEQAERDRVERTGRLLHTVDRHPTRRTRRRPGLRAYLGQRRHAGAGDGTDELICEELLATVFLLVMAGFDTTANLIASGALALATNPGQMAGLCENLSLLPTAVEKLLQLTSPVNHANDRFTTEMGGTW